jgi:hypothetical protein
MISAKQYLPARTFGFFLAMLLAVGGSAAVAMAQSNTAFGSGALANNTGGGNSGFGVAALGDNTSGSNNNANGYLALINNTTGTNNTADGALTLMNNTTSDNNTAIGGNALFNNTGRANTAVGSAALFNNTAGFRNTASGGSALFNNTGGDNNIALGWQAGVNLTTGNNNIEIGSPGAAAEDSTIHVGTQGTQDTTFIAGISGTALTGMPAAVFVSSTGQLGIMPSSLRYKRDIRSLENRSRGLWRLRPVTFRYKQNPQGQRQYGLIAEEVAKVYPELVVRDNKGEIESVQYHELIPLMLNEMQHQQTALDTLKAQNAALQARLQRLEQNKTLADLND